MRKLCLLFVLTAVAITASTAQAGRTQQLVHLKHSRDVVRFFNHHEWMLARRHDKCAAVSWRRTCSIARSLYHNHQSLVAEIRGYLWFSLPKTNDWRTSVKLAQRPYPGTESWLLYISDREGGWGSFVMNHQGSGAGGWMQFMSGTFYGYVDAARQETARRGFKVPPEVWTWTHPLGQALVAGYMRYTHRDGCHWCL